LVGEVDYSTVLGIAPYQADPYANGISIFTPTPGSYKLWTPVNAPG